MQTSEEKSFLLNLDESQITSAKWPCDGQVLTVLFYYMRKGKLNLRSRACLVVKEVEIFWKKARIPTKKMQRNIVKSTPLCNKWKAL